MPSASHDQPDNVLSEKVRRVNTVDEVAAEFGQHANTVRKWVSKGCPCDRPGGNKPILFDLAEVAKWRRDQGLTGDPGRPANRETGDLQSARTRKENAMADWHELRVATAKKELLPAGEVEETWTRHVLAARSEIIEIPAAVAPQLVGLDAPEIQTILEARIRAVLTKLSQGNDRDMGTPESGDAGLLASTGADVAERVGGTVPNPPPADQCGTGPVAE
jgi:phage terminase Nu1 subunit (DNA packaging protein)